MICERVSNTRCARDLVSRQSIYVRTHTSKLNIRGKDEKRINKINLKEMVNKMHGTVREKPTERRRKEKKKMNGRRQ